MNKKILKLAFITTSMTTLVATATTTVSCWSFSGSTNQKDWKTFASVAKDEDAHHIIANASPAAQGWTNLLASDLSFKQKPKEDNSNTTVTAIIVSNSKNQVATFTITYTKKTAYSVKDWKCTVQPTTADPVEAAWRVFEVAASKDNFANIVKNSDLKDDSWSHLDNSDFTIVGTRIIDQAKRTITITIKSTSLNQEATFMITFVSGTDYADTKWTCTVKPHDASPWNSFKKDEAADKKTNIIKNSDLTDPKWKALVEDDLSFESPNPTIDDDAHTIKVTLISASLKQKATFMITFVSGTDYADTKWTCTVKPGPTLQ